MAVARRVRIFASSARDPIMAWPLAGRPPEKTVSQKQHSVSLSNGFSLDNGSVEGQSHRRHTEGIMANDFNLHQAKKNSRPCRHNMQQMITSQCHQRRTWRHKSSQTNLQGNHCPTYSWLSCMQGRHGCRRHVSRLVCQSLADLNSFP